MNRPDPTYKRSNVTYGQLHRALSSLGVSHRLDRTDPPGNVYEHPERGLIAVLAAYPESDRVVDYHLVGLRTLLDQFGIADPEVFDAEVRKYGEKSHAGRSQAPRDRMSAFPDGFNPAIDRYDRRSAARLFRWLWPDPDTARACAANFATSIRAAHQAGEGSWTVTMHAHALRLNVGQVETLTLLAEDSRFLFRKPVDLGSDQRFEVIIEDDPVYPAVPVASGVCLVPSGEMVAFPTGLRASHNAYIQAAAPYKRVSPFRNSFSPAVLEHIEDLLGEPLPRPSYLNEEVAHRVEPLADELDASSPIREGARYQITVNAYERDPRARRLCIAHHGTSCAICGFSFGATYGEVAEGFIHVHHLRPLSEIGEEYEVDPVADLRPVCPNCHAVLHRRNAAYSIAEVQAFLRRR